MKLSPALLPYLMATLFKMMLLSTALTIKALFAQALLSAFK